MKLHKKSLLCAYCEEGAITWQHYFDNDMIYGLCLYHSYIFTRVMTGQFEVIDKKLVEIMTIMEI